jgi:chromate transporter
VGIFFLDAPFPLIVAGAGAAGFAVARASPGLLGLQAQPAAPAATAPGQWQRAAITAAIGLVLWWAPVALAGVMLGREHVFVDIGMFFSKLAIVSFGGAYALLAYMAQEAVETYRWMAAPEMVDGLGLAETLPGPLIKITQFVGFLGAWRDPAPLTPATAGVLGSALTTWVTFVPPMLLIFVAAPFIEQLRSNQRLSGALAAITAAVVGVILNLTVWFALHVLFARVEEARAGPLRWYAFDPSSVDPVVSTLALVAAVLAFGLHRGLVELVVSMAALGVATKLLLGA